MNATPLAAPGSFEARSLRRRAERRWLRTLRLGLVPATIISALAILVVINTILFLESISGYQPSFENDIPARLTACVVALFILQAVALWILGIVSAILSRHALTASGTQLSQRLAIMNRRYAFLARAVLSLRVMLLLILIIAFVLTVTTVFGLNLVSDISSSIWLDARYQPLTVGLAAFIGLLSWIFGPFLRLRYSMSLGALASTWSRRPDEQFWLALSARLLVEMVGVLFLVWAISVLNLVTYITFDPLPGAGAPNSLPAIIGMLPLETIGGSSWLGGVVVGCLYIIGQLGLPIWFVRLARWRLQRQAHADTRKEADGSSTHQSVVEVATPVS